MARLISSRSRSSSGGGRRSPRNLMTKNKTTKTTTKTTSSTNRYLQVFGLIAVAYIGSMAWLEGPVAKKLFHGQLGPPTKAEFTLPIPATTTSTTSTASGGDVVDRKLQQVAPSIQQQQQQRRVIEKKEKEEPNFLPRVLAFVFPQFHPDALNDRLWGEGFTDWDSLRKAPAKNRLGYAIPRPTELGYYDYRDSEPRRLQGELAKQYELDGLIFHHYWFYDSSSNGGVGGPNLHAPLERMLQDGYPNIPFALHWCATKWVNTWNGAVRPDFVFQEPNVLQKQYFPSNQTDPTITDHYNWLRRFFHHPNYIQVDGKPLFMLYQKKPSSFPVLKRLNELAILDGFTKGLYLTVGMTMPHGHLEDIGNPRSYDPPPQQFARVASKHFERGLAYPNPYQWNEHKTLEIPTWCLRHERKRRIPDIAGIISSFDNTPRRNYDEARLWSAEQPDKVVKRFYNSLFAALYYEACCFFDLEKHSRQQQPRNQDDRFIVINAMNEWAEGMALEPSDVYGRRFLEAIRDAKNAVRKEGENKCNLSSIQESKPS